MEYRHRTFPRQRKIRTERATGKLMFTIFWDTEGLVYREFLLKGTTVNSERFTTLRVLKRLFTRVRPHHAASWGLRTQTPGSDHRFAMLIVQEKTQTQILGRNTLI